MARFRRIAAVTLLVAAIAVAVGASWLIVMPPPLLSVGSGYAAKIVCSNTFLAGRDPDAVMAVDVQAPGHPLLRLMWQSVDPVEKTVTTHLLGLFAPGYAAYREGFGCASVPDGDFEAARHAVSDIALPAHPEKPVDAIWPEGTRVAADKAIQSILADPERVGSGMRAMVVVHDGRIVAEAYGEGFDAETPLLGWSMTKTVNAAFVGRLLQAGRMSLQDAGFFPEWMDDGRSRITLSNLLAMRSGLAFNENYGGVTDVTRMLYLEPNMSRFAASFPLAANPGEAFSYSSGTSVILSRIWMNTLGNRWDALAFPRQALFVPLGMTSAVMETDETGIYVGASHLYATARDWARFSLFLVNDGVWNGERLLPEGFVAAMGRPTAVSDGAYSEVQTWIHGPGGEPNGEHGLPADTFWMLGHDGQAAAIIPSLNLAVIRLGLTPSRDGYRPQPMVRAVVDALAAG